MLEYGLMVLPKTSFLKAQQTVSSIIPHMSGFPGLWLPLWPFSGSFPACPHLLCTARIKTECFVNSRVCKIPSWYNHYKSDNWLPPKLLACFCSEQHTKQEWFYPSLMDIRQGYWQTLGYFPKSKIHRPCLYLCFSSLWRCSLLGSLQLLLLHIFLCIHT